MPSRPFPALSSVIAAAIPHQAVVDLSAICAGTPVPPARFDAPFEHPDWIFEPKLDGFRALAYVEGGTCRLVSRNRNAFKTFEPLAQAIGQELSGRSAILYGEIVRPGPDGRPMFYAI